MVEIQKGQQEMPESMHGDMSSTGTFPLPPGSGLQQPTMESLSYPIIEQQFDYSHSQQLLRQMDRQQTLTGLQKKLTEQQKQLNQFQQQRALNGQQGHQTMLQGMQNNIGSIAMQGSFGLSSSLPPGGALQQPNMANVASQNSNLNNIQNMYTVQQNALWNTMWNYYYLQAYQQFLLLPAMMQTSSLSLPTVVQNPQPVVLPQSSQPLMNHQTQTISSLNQRLTDQQNKLSSLPQSPLQSIGQLNNISSMQQQQNLQLQQLQLQQQYLQQQQLLRNINSRQQMLLSNMMPIQQQNHQSSTSLLPTLVQQSQLLLQQLLQQQQQLMGMQQRLSTTSGFQQQTVIDEPKQLFQQQRAMTEASSTLLDSTAQTGNPNDGDWQEEVYQKITAMKVLYLQDLNSLHQNATSKLQQLPQQQETEKLEKWKGLKSYLEYYIQFLQTPKHAILPNYKDKLGICENHIVSVINRYRLVRRKAQAVPPPHTQSLQQSQQTHSQQSQPQLQQQMGIQQSHPTTSDFQQQTVIGQLPQQQMGMPEASSASLVSTANPYGRVQDEEVCQKLKDLYLQDLNNMHEKFVSKLQQIPMAPQQEAKTLPQSTQVQSHDNQKNIQDVMKSMKLE